MRFNRLTSEGHTRAVKRPAAGRPPLGPCQHALFLASSAASVWPTRADDVHRAAGFTAHLALICCHRFEGVERPFPSTPDPFMIAAHSARMSPCPASG